MKKKRMNIYSVKDQMERYVLSEEEAIEKIKQIKNVNVFSVDWQMKKFKISKEEAIDKINSIKNKLRESQNNMTEFDFNSMIPSKKEHWIKKGFSEEESEKMVSENIKLATKNCNDFIKRVKESPDEYKDVMPTQFGFYLKQGYNEIEAKNILSKRQSTFNYTKCIEKYGEVEGHRIWKERQEKWYEKTKDKLSKGEYLKYESILKEFGGNEELADKIYSERISNISKSKFGNASKRSLKLFKQLCEICHNNNLKYFIGDDENKEYYLFDKSNKKIYFYDFTILDIKLIFEFNGRLWHSKKFLENNINQFGFNLSNQFVIDKLKRELAEKNGFEVIYLWEEDGFEHNIKKSTSILMDRIKNYQL
jgi:hypothetical protein